MARILLVEDCPDTQMLVQRTLAHHEVVMAGTIQSADHELGRQSFDLVLLDLGLPDGDGFSLASKLKADPKHAELALIFLTGSSETRDKVMAFELDADDYVQKPVQSAELRARVDARLRSSKRRSSQILYVADLCLDPLHHRVTRQEEGGAVEIELTPHEFQLLHLLGKRRGEIVRRNVILSQIWRNVAVGGRTIDTHVSNLRRKLGSAHISIEAIRGLGYRLRVEAEEDAEVG
jgi:DNA-binding response OmpR family regulator